MHSSENVRELTVRALVIGLMIGTVLTAANTYLGLYAGMTVSGSIPAAILSIGILRGMLSGGTVHENNIVQTVASAGQAVAAGIIFTVPALIITGVWSEFPYWKVTAIALLGGLLGVLVMIPLRRALIVEEKDLIYPEGVACAQVLKAGDAGGGAMKTIMAALGSGLFFKSLTGLVGVFRGTAEIAWRMGGTVLYLGTDVSVALLSVGVIVGIEIGVAALTGSLIAWGISIPIYYLQNPVPDGPVLDSAWAAWSSHIRYMGVGAMVVGGLSSMWGIRHGIAKAIRRLIGQVGGIGAGGSTPRTDKDLPIAAVGGMFCLVAAGTFGIYRLVTGSLAVAITAGVVMLIAAVFFVAVASYICGLVGSSNNPISGMTICALMFASLVLLILGMSGTSGILGALGVASIVCCAAATGGDTSQDLKTGYLVGATPMKQQLAEFAGVIVPIFAIAPVLSLLHNAYGIGTDAPGALKAPQATLFASIAEGLFGDSDLPWTMVWIGVLIAIGLLVLDWFLRRAGSRFRAHVMPVAVGIYLPLSLMVPIFLGGLISQQLKKIGEGASRRRVLIASGLIAGEAIAGILIAIPKTVWTDAEIPIPVADSLWLSLAGLAAAMYLIYRFAANRRSEG